MFSRDHYDLFVSEGGISEHLADKIRVRWIITTCKHQVRVVLDYVLGRYVAVSAKPESGREVNAPGDFYYIVYG